MRHGGARRSRIRERDLPSFDPDELEEAPGDEAEAAEEQILDRGDGRREPRRTEAEIALLKELEDRRCASDSPGRTPNGGSFSQSSTTRSFLIAATGLRRKIIIFTEPRDTLEYLQQKIAGDDRRSGRCRRDPRRHCPRGASRGDRRLQQRPRRARHDR